MAQRFKNVHTTLLTKGSFLLHWQISVIDKGVWAHIEDRVNIQTVMQV